jgi:hypothetical protein
MHYKAPDNSLHFLDDARFTYLLPAGSVPITDAQAEALRPKPPPPPPPPPASAVAKLQAFLDANPDVAALINV